MDEIERKGKESMPEEDEEELLRHYILFSCFHQNCAIKDSLKNTE